LIFNHETSANRAARVDERWQNYGEDSRLV
jgi:hypothetical protein